MVIPEILAQITEEIEQRYEEERGPDPRLRRIQVSPFMRLYIAESKDFRVRPLYQNDTPRAIVPGGTSWEWDIAPMSAGKEKRLELVYVAYPDYPNNLTEYSDSVTYFVDVDTNLLYTIRMFLQGNWKWILASIILPSISAVVPAIRNFMLEKLQSLLQRRHSEQ